MRVLFVDQGLGVGGSIISLYYLVRELAARGIEPVVHFPAPHAWSGRYEALGVEVRYETSGGGSPPRPAGDDERRPWIHHPLYRTLSFYKSHAATHGAAVRHWRSRLSAIAPEAVYGNNGVAPNFAALEAAAGAGLGVYCHLRGFQPLHAPHRAFAPRLVAGIAISDAVRKHYLRQGFPPDRIHRVHNGVEVADYPYRDPAAEVAARGGRILFLGRLAGWKGAGVLIEALARLARTRPEMSAVIAGDGPARTAWEAEAGKLGLAAGVRFVGFQSDVMRLLREADVLVHASTSPEPFGRVLVESMAAGVPVVASHLGATPEIVVDGVTGRLVAPGDPAALAAALDELLSSGFTRIEMARAARRRVEEHFSVARTGEAVARILAGTARPGR